jgi:hypothetical protein
MDLKILIFAPTHFFSLINSQISVKIVRDHTKYSFASQFLPHKEKEFSFQMI